MEGGGWRVEPRHTLSEPCSIARIVSSRYAIFLGELTAVLMSSGLSPVSEPNYGEMSCEVKSLLPSMLFWVVVGCDRL